MKVRWECGVYGARRGAGERGGDSRCERMGSARLHAVQPSSSSPMGQVEQEVRFAVSQLDDLR